MAPNAPVKNFRFPRFAENGYTQWVLQGAKGIYDNEEQLRVEGMALRIYSGDERMAKELALESPKATIRLKENRAFSDQPIEIVGENFKISGTGWEWIGATKEIVVQNDAVVDFTQVIRGGFSSDPSQNETRQTTIRSDQLVLQTTTEAYNFEFSGSVQVDSGEMDLQSNLLIAVADAPEGETETPKLNAEELDTFKEIVASEEVVIVQDGKTVRADKAEFLTREGRATLTGSPEIEVAGAYLTGHVVRTQAGELIIEGEPGKGRAQMILTDTGGLGMQGISALSQETIVLADVITMQELEGVNRFLFEDRVQVMSGAVQLEANKMTILSEAADEAAGKQPDSDGEGDLKVGEVRQMIAEGAVKIEQSGQVATGDKVVFYPSEERCVLTGNPKVTNEESIITGHKMELKPKQATVHGKGEEKVSVTLPEMPDLGYQTFMPTLANQEEEEASKEKVEPEPTIVRSNLLHMTEEPDRTLFRFTDAVEIAATNLDATCERLDVIAVETEDSGSADDPSQGLQVQRIEAHESVEIRQTGRTATASRAFILPEEGKVILEDNAVVKDERGTVSGYRMTLLQGERKAIVEGGVPGQERARITLPELPGREEAGEEGEEAGEEE